MTRFGRSLNEVNTLLAIGYSFRDDHVNEAVRRWLNADAAHRIVVVEPSFTHSARSGGSNWSPSSPYGSNFPGQLLWSLEQTSEQRGLDLGDDTIKSHAQAARDSRILVYRQTAQAALADAAAAAASDKRWPTTNPEDR